MKKLDKDMVIIVVTTLSLIISFTFMTLFASAEANGSSIPFPVYLIGFNVFFLAGLGGILYYNLRDVK